MALPTRFSLPRCVVMAVLAAAHMGPSAAFVSSPRHTRTTTTTTTKTVVFGKRMKFQPPAKVVAEPQLVQVQADGSDAWRTMDVVDILQRGGVGVLPTNTGYGVVTPLDSKTGVQRLSRMCHQRRKHKIPGLTLLVSHLSQLDEHVHMYGLSKTGFKMLKASLPGTDMFVLPCTKGTQAVLRKYHGDHTHADALGIQIPSDPVLRYLQDELLEGNTPLLMADLPDEQDDDDDDDDDYDDEQLLQQQQMEKCSLVDMTASWCHQVDFVVQAGSRPARRAMATTVWDMTSTASEPRLVQEGLSTLELLAAAN